VIEVLYLQKRKDLERLADDYILGSDSDIRVVVGLDIEYKTGKKAPLSAGYFIHHHDSLAVTKDIVYRMAKGFASVVYQSKRHLLK